jgi:hypothetical protein
MKQEFENLLIWWDVGETKIKDIAIWASRKLNKTENYIRELENKIANLTEKEENELSNINEIWKEITNYYENKARIRANKRIGMNKVKNQLNPFFI